jgi:hypothetical protein
VQAIRFDYVWLDFRTTKDANGGKGHELNMLSVVCNLRYHIKGRIENTGENFSLFHERLSICSFEYGH